PRSPADLCSPVLALKLDRTLHIEIGPPPHHQKRSAPGHDPQYGLRKVIEKKNVRVHVTHARTRSQRLCLRKKVADQRRPPLVALYRGNVSQTEFRGNLGRARLRPEKNHSRIWIHVRPTHDRIELDHPDVPFELLGSSKDCERLPIWLLGRGKTHTNPSPNPSPR